MPARKGAGAGLPEYVVNVEQAIHRHRIRATGAVLTARLLHAMRREGVRRGVRWTPCASAAAMGIAFVLEAPEACLNQIQDPREAEARHAK